MKVKIYADGSCLGNGHAVNFGGFGVVVVVNEKLFTTHKEGYRNTTNNAMELLGLLKAVNIAVTLKQEVEIFCDSAYAVNTVNLWMHSWAANNWIKKSDKRPPENLDIIKKLYELLNFNDLIKVVKVKGHSTDVYNQLADKLAVAASMDMQGEYLKNRT